MKRCKTCKHWAERKALGTYNVSAWADRDQHVHDGRGVCVRGSRTPTNQDDESLMWGEDASDFCAVVVTRPDFGCVMWEERGIDDE